MGVFLASKATSHAPNFKTDMLGHDKIFADSWAPAVGGGHLPPLEFEKMTSYSAALQNTLKPPLAYVLTLGV